MGNEVRLERRPLRYRLFKTLIKTFGKLIEKIRKGHKIETTIPHTKMFEVRMHASTQDDEGSQKDKGWQRSPSALLSEMYKMKLELVLGIGCIIVALLGILIMAGISVFGCYYFSACISTNSQFVNCDWYFLLLTIIVFVAITISVIKFKREKDEAKHN